MLRGSETLDLKAALGFFRYAYVHDSAERFAVESLKESVKQARQSAERSGKITGEWVDDAPTHADLTEHLSNLGVDIDNLAAQVEALADDAEAELRAAEEAVKAAEVEATVTATEVEAAAKKAEELEASKTTIAECFYNNSVDKLVPR